MLAIVTPERPRRGAAPSASAGRCAATVVGRVTEPATARPAAHPRRLRRRGAGRRAGVVASTTPPRSTTGPAGRAGRPRPTRRAAEPRPPPADAAAPTCSTCSSDTVVGVVASTTTSCSSTPSRARAATPPCCASSTRPPASTPAGAWRSPPTATTAGAPSTRGRARRSTVAEAVLNLACVGARPLAVVNCLNFGNPEHPEVMWQLSEAIDGMAEACRGVRRCPVIGGNVSLYNESAGADIDPTPVVGMLGVVDRLDRRPPGRRPRRRRPPAAARRRRQPELVAARRGRGAEGHRGGTLPGARPRRTHTAVADLVRDLVAGGLRRRRPRRRRRRPRPRAGRDGGALRRRLPRRPASRRRRAVRRAPSRVVLSRRPERLRPCSSVCEQAGVPAARHRGGRRRPPRGQGPARRRARRRHRRLARTALPDALGAGTGCTALPIAAARLRPTAVRRDPVPPRRGERWSSTADRAHRRRRSDRRRDRLDD